MGNINGPFVGPVNDAQQGESSAHFDEISRAVCDALNHRTITASTRLVLSEPDRLSLIEPLMERMRAGVLSSDELIGFVSGVVHGGIPTAYLLKEPTMPLDLTNLEGMKEGRWLPPYLQERLVVPEHRAAELNVQQERIVDAIQGALRDEQVDLPIFFLGSAASQRGELPRDIDIGTSRSLRSQHMDPYDRVFQNLRERMHGGLILGDKNHVGSVWSDFHLALGVSVTRYDRALRVTASDLYRIGSSSKER